MCQEIANDKKNHVQAIETSCKKKIFDNVTEYQGMEEQNAYIRNVKCRIREYSDYGSGADGKNAEIYSSIICYNSLEGTYYQITPGRL